MQARILEGLQVLSQIYGDEPVILVTHAGPIKMMRAFYETPTGISLPEYVSSYVPPNGEV